MHKVKSSPITATVYCPRCHQPNRITPRQGCDEKCEHCGKDYVVDVRAETLEKYLGVEYFEEKSAKGENRCPVNHSPAGTER